MTADRYRFEPLGDQHDRTGFTCGVAPLDRYLRTQAGQDRRRRLAAPFVCYDTATSLIVGYYTLSATAVTPAALSVEVTRRLPRYDHFPATLIGRLAVDLRYRGQGFGELLLLDALARCLAEADQIAAMAVVVDAKDDAARAFYEHYRFRRFEDHPYRLYLPMATIESLGLSEPGRGRDGA